MYIVENVCAIVSMCDPDPGTIHIRESRKCSAHSNIKPEHYIRDTHIPDIYIYMPFSLTPIWAMVHLLSSEMGLMWRYAQVFRYPEMGPDGALCVSVVSHRVPVMCVVHTRIRYIQISHKYNTYFNLDAAGLVSELPNGNELLVCSL